jgi:tetratricopeptide (TPR) repeat protein
MRERGEFCPEAMSRILDIILGTAGLVIFIGVAGWAFFYLLKRSDDPAKIIFKLLFSVGLVVGEVFFVHSLTRHLSGGESPGDYGVSFMIAGSIAACGIILSIFWTPHISDFLVSPLTDLFDGGKEPPEPRPYYSIALSKRKLNRPLEAIVAVREQLAKFPSDFEGVSLLATIQAEDMKDLQSAEITFDHFCNLPVAPDKQVAAAWTQMADWHLKLAQDSDSARVSLGKIIAKYPDTGLSLAAAQRIAHLDGTVKQLLAPHDRRAMFLPEGVKSAGLRTSMADLVPEETNPETLAADLVKHLELHPLDTEAREKLAIIYARHYKRLDLATLELKQLAEQPNQPHKLVAHWLNLLADLQIHGGADYETVRDTLLKIVEMFPDLPVAQVARSRMDRLKLEFKGQSKAPENKTLGVYEQNIGLKYGTLRRS